LKNLLRLLGGVLGRWIPLTAMVSHSIQASETFRFSKHNDILLHFLVKSKRVSRKRKDSKAQRLCSFTEIPYMVNPALPLIHKHGLQ